MYFLGFYLFKVVLISGILSGYYYVALRNKIFHQWNRFYILFSLIASLFLPLITIQIQSFKSADNHIFQTIHSLSNTNTIIENSELGSSIPYASLILGVYIIISGLIFSSILYTFIKILKIKKRFESTQIGDISFINTDEPDSPFSFLKTIFWNQKIPLASEHGQQIFKHELVHVRQKHTYDKLFARFIITFFWMNPFYWLLQKELDMIHEFIADQHSIKNNSSEELSKLIFATVYPGHRFSITNNFFYSPIKRRLNMIIKNKNPRITYFSRLLVLPLAAIVFTIFSVKISWAQNQNAKDTQFVQESDFPIDTIPQLFYNGKKVNNIILLEHENKVKVTYEGGTEETITMKEAKKRKFLPPPPPPKAPLPPPQMTPPPPPPPPLPPVTPDHYNGRKIVMWRVKDKKVELTYEDYSTENISIKDARKAGFLFTPPKVVKDSKEKKKIVPFAAPKSKK